MESENTCVTKHYMVLHVFGLPIWPSIFSSPAQKPQMPHLTRGLDAESLNWRDWTMRSPEKTCATKIHLTANSSNKENQNCGNHNTHHYTIRVKTPATTTYQQQWKMTQQPCASIHKMQKEKIYQTTKYPKRTIQPKTTGTYKHETNDWRQNLKIVSLSDWFASSSLSNVSTGNTRIYKTQVVHYGIETANTLLQSLCKSATCNLQNWTCSI